MSALLLGIYMANNLHITYDLITPGQDYTAVIEKIKSLGAWAKVTESFWYVQSDLTASQARDQIKLVLDPNDKLYVVDSTNGAAAWNGLSKVVSDFILDKWS